MKILFICEFFPKTTQLDVHGGIETRTFQIAKFLAKYHQVEVLASKEIDKPSRQLLDGIDIRRVGKKRHYVSSNRDILSRISYIISAVRVGLTLDFDLVEGTGFISWIPAWILSQHRHKKGVILVPDVIEAYVKDKPRVLFWTLRIIERFLITRKWSQIICISNTIKKKVLLLKAEAEISVIYCGADTQRIRRIKVIQKKKFTICCISRLVAYKHIDVLIKAISLASDTYPGIRLEIVGVGEELSKLRQLVKDRNIASQVMFHGFVYRHEEVLKLIKASHLFSLPSTVEGFGIATVEAFAAGLPAVLADIPINHEITAEHGALFFKHQDATDLAQKIICLLVNKKLYQKLSREALEISQTYDWKKIAQQTKTLYENLCAD